MPTKTCAVTVKATAADDPNLKEGQFTALASVFNNIDAVGDVVLPGAFADDLKAWEESGDPIPVLWGHQMADPDMNIGSVMTAGETEQGLQITAQLDLENEKAKQVYRLLKGRRVRKMSFAYDVEDAAPAERDGREVYELRKLKLHEVSVVQIPANPEAVVQQVKDAAVVGERLVAAITEYQRLHTDTKTTDDAPPDVKAGRSISAKNEATLRSALDRMTGAISDVKSLLDSLESDDGKASPTQHATAEEPDGAKTDEPASRSGTASLRLLADLTQEAAEVISLTD